jgi:hypothetical protein
LKKHYEARYSVLRAESGRAALDLLRCSGGTTLWPCYFWIIACLK